MKMEKYTTNLNGIKNRYEKKISMKVQTVVGQVLIILDAATVDTIHRNCAHFHRYPNNRHIHLSDEWTSVHCCCCPQMEFAKCLSATHFTSACDAHLESDGIKKKPNISLCFICIAKNQKVAKFSLNFWKKNKFNWFDGIFRDWNSAKWFSISL